MMLIRLFLFLLLLILPDMYIYKEHIRRVLKMDTLGLLASQSVSLWE